MLAVREERCDERSRLKTPFTADVGAARFAMLALLSRWRCFNATSRLPAGIGRRVFLCGGCAAESFKLTRAAPRYHFTESAAGLSTSVVLPQMRLAYHGRARCRGDIAIVGINAASVDNPSWFRPQDDIFTSVAQPWIT